MPQKLRPSVWEFWAGQTLRDDWSGFHESGNFRKKRSISQVSIMLIEDLISKLNHFCATKCKASLFKPSNRLTSVTACKTVRLQ